MLGPEKEKGEKQSLRLKKGAIRVTYKNEADRKIYDDRRGGSASIRPLYIAVSQIQSTGIHAEFAFSYQKLLLFSRPKSFCFSFEKIAQQLVLSGYSKRIRGTFRFSVDSTLHL